MTKLLAGTAKSAIGIKEEACLHDQLYAKVLVLDDGIRTLVILALDAIAIGCIFDLSDHFLPRLRTRIHQELGIPAEQILVNATHTHTAGRMLREETEVIDGVFTAVSVAIHNRVPAVVGTASGREENIIINRTLHLSDGSNWTIRHTNCSPPDEMVESLGKVDSEIGVLRIDRADDGSPLAVVFNYGCHPLLGVPSGQVTANFPGVACTQIEKELGHNCMAIFLQGTGGDVIELLNKDFSGPRSAYPFGIALAAATLDAWRTIVPGQASLDSVYHHTEFPRRNDSNARIAELHEQERNLLKSLRHTALNFKNFLGLYLAAQCFPEYPTTDRYRYLQEATIGQNGLVCLDKLNRMNIDKYLQNIQAMESLARIQDRIATFERHRNYNVDSNSTTIPAEIIAFRIGDAVIVSNPTEAVTEVGLHLKSRSPFPHTFLTAYSNGYMHYGPMPEDYDKGGYEVTECFLAPGWYPVFEKTALNLLDRLYQKYSCRTNESEIAGVL